MDSLEINKEKFFKAAARIERPGKRALLAWLERETDFFTAPSSSKYHGAHPGGLVEHSLNVWGRLDEIVNRDLMNPAAPDFCDTAELAETVAILGLLPAHNLRLDLSGDLFIQGPARFIANNNLQIITAHPFFTVL